MLNKKVKDSTALRFVGTNPANCLIPARQCSARGGELYLHPRPDGRVDVAGAATVVLKGNFNITV